VALGITLASLVASVRNGHIVDELENKLEAIMADPVWSSIERKIAGHYAAAQFLPASCPQCAKILEPVDFGVDPDSNERLWVTHCCGQWDKYLEKLGEQQLP
jgi:hypothetical protein